MGHEDATASRSLDDAGSELDVKRLREEFPILEQRIHGKPLVYLDTTASAQKPREVIDAIERFYESECSNVHRGLHELSVRATADFEAVRDSVQRFIGAGDRREIIFTRGTTESINLVAHSYGGRHLAAGDEVLITEMEHHSNIVPWQLLCERVGARLRVAPINDAGELRLDELERRLGPRTRLLALTHISNVLGTRNPVRQIIEMAHANGTPVLIDGAQGVVHDTVNVRELDCDFYAFSGHKMYGPTGVGVLYGKAELLESMPPFLGGGDMIRTVSFEGTTFNELPYKFEAGTPNIAGVIGLGAAVSFVNRIGMERIARSEHALLQYALRRFEQMPFIQLIGTARDRVGVISLNVDGVHPHDVGTVLDQEGIAVRAGHHCAQPLMQRLGVPATVRVSLACHSIPDEIDTLVRGLETVREVFG